MPDYFYVYPSYIQRKKSRSLGRRIPQSLSVEDEVTLEEMASAARRLGYTVHSETEKHYPRTSYLYQGRLKVEKRPGTTKTAFLRALAIALQHTHKSPG